MVLELPDEPDAAGESSRVCLRGQVARVGHGGLGVRSASEQPERLLLVNYLMRCHAHGA